MAARTTRAVRSDGERSRRAILQAAAPCDDQRPRPPLDRRPGVPRGHEHERAVRPLRLGHLAAARDHGDLQPDADLEQLTFDVKAYLAMAHSLFTFTGDERAFDRAARAVRTRLGVA